MGFLKSITRPISKVLDKIIPNEIKPALPYMAAFAPFMMGPQSGIMGSSMLRRALTSGAFNLGSQLAQEGSEGEFNPLSVLLASGTGAMTSPDAPGFFEGMQKGPTGADQFGNISVPYSDTGIMSSISDAVGKGGQTAAKFLIEQGKVLRPDETPLTMTNALTAGALPVTQATADLAMADARLALRDYEDQMAADESTSLIDDDGRRRAIRAAMEASNHLESTILDTLAALGLKQGGIVGLKHGGQLVKRGPGRPGYAGDYSWAKKQYLIDLQDGLIPSDTTFSEWLENNAPDPDHDKIYAKGGRINKEGGGVASVLPKGKEADYRGGGVIPVGSRERADDVPARLSKNEFVMTADAVRAAGGGSINKGAKRMYNLMHNLEARV